MPKFLLTVFIISTMFFIISGILFWSTDYFVDVLLVPKSNVTLYFALTSLSSPISGALLSQPLLGMIGSFQSKYAMPLCLVITSVAFFFAAWIPFADNFGIAIGLMWIILFGGGALLPLLTGIMITSVEPEMR